MVQGLGYELFPLHLSHFLIARFAPGTIRPTFYSPQRLFAPWIFMMQSHGILKQDVYTEPGRSTLYLSTSVLKYNL